MLKENHSLSAQICLLNKHVNQCSVLYLVTIMKLIKRVPAHVPLSVASCKVVCCIPVGLSNTCLCLPLSSLNVSVWHLFYTILFLLPEDIPPLPWCTFDVSIGPRCTTRDIWLVSNVLGPDQEFDQFASHLLSSSFLCVCIHVTSTKNMYTSWNVNNLFCILSTVIPKGLFFQEEAV